MSERALYKDDLHSGSDKWLFTSLFVVGTIGIFAAKIWTASPFLPVVVGVGILFLYGLMVRRVARFRVREDRAGDGAYYLGFLFTLVSLSYALLEFAQAGQHVERVIGHFAVALATTIVGLVMRVWFQQLREDPVESEPELRASLAHASETLKAEVLMAVESVAVWRTKVLHELSDEIHGALREHLHQTGAALNRTLDEYRDLVKETSLHVTQDRTAAAQQTAEYRKAANRIVAALGRVADRIDATPLPTDALSQSYRKMTSAVDQLAIVCAGLADGISQSLTPAMKAIGDIEHVADGLERHMAGITNATTNLEGRVNATESAVGSLVAALERSAAMATAISQREEERAAAVNTALEAQLRAIERTNAALEQSMSQSRKAVSQVHEELAGAARTIEREIRASRR